MLDPYSTGQIVQCSAVRTVPHPDRPDSTIRFRRLSSRAGRHGRLHALPICMLHCTSPLLETAAAGAWLARKAGQLFSRWDAGRRNVNTSGASDHPLACTPLDWHEGLSRFRHASCRDTLCDAAFQAGGCTAQRQLFVRSA